MNASRQTREIRAAARKTVDEVGVLLSSGDIVRQYRISRTTLVRWADDGQITRILTPGGHHRFRETEIKARVAKRRQHEDTT